MKRQGNLAKVPVFRVVLDQGLCGAIIGIVVQRHIYDFFKIDRCFGKEVCLQLCEENVY